MISIDYVPLGIILEHSQPIINQSNPYEPALAYANHVAYGVEYALDPITSSHVASQALGKAFKASQMARVLSDRSYTANDIQKPNNLPSWAFDVLVNLHRISFVGFDDGLPVYRIYGLQGWYFDCTLDNQLTIVSPR